VPGEHNPNLPSLYNRDEFEFQNYIDEKHFKNEERKLVAKRREEYAKRVSSKVFQKLTKFM
jgi:uncharacterized phage-associated protein